MAEEKGKVVAGLYRGMPSVEVTQEEKTVVRADLNATNKLEGSPKGPISISLESLDVDLQHNQSFGMVAVTTGCISNPGGPQC